MLGPGRGLGYIQLIYKLVVCEEAMQAGCR
jgi:hypothetical protein